ncbi:alpha/beta hydrolase family protein [Flavobacterium sp. RHBU_3]|uniref:alpha/beta hydrolase family protein n=1 Tax=Flavobacterium sp. RHBU_3 TaxID=3391184 RepID=UPI003984D132
MLTLRNILLPVLCCFPLWGEAQQVKSNATPEDYRQFSRLSLSAVAPQGDWVSYHLAYKEADTLFLKSSRSKAQYALRGGRQPSFIDAETFIAQLPENRLQIINLKSGKTFTTEHITSYEPIPGRSLIIGFEAETDKSNSLHLVNSKNGGLLTTLKGVLDFKYNEKNDILAYICSAGTTQSLKLLNLHGNAEQTLYSNSAEISLLCWQQDGKYLGFASKATNGTPEVHRYDLVQQKLYSINPAADAEQRSSVENVNVGPQGTLLFTTIPQGNTGQRSQPEVWHAADSMLVPLQTRMGDYSKKELLSWIPGSDIIRINSPALPIYQYTGNRDYVLLRGTGANPADSLLYPITDFYIADVLSAKKKLLVKGLSTDPGFLSACPINNNIVFYARGNWQLYHPESGAFLNLTGQMNTKWDTSGTNALPPARPFGLAGWTADGKGVYLYDEYDIYLATAEGKCNRLTHGRSKGIVFRLISQGSVNSFDPTKVLYILGTSEKDNSESYYRLLPTGKLKIIDSQKGHVRQPVCSQSGIAYLFERFDTPPCIKMASGQSTAQTIFKSNLVQDKFLWGKSELITYQNTSGQQMKAALFYPAGYIPGVKYPVVTFVYQNMSDRLHHYEVPWDENGIGINITRFTLNGYMVLLPDIYYRTGAPGISALECVTAATQKVIDMDIADPGRLGLIGTSFGGYETAYIISGTNMFAAAVSGSMISDLTASYFSVGEQILLPELWRYETQIFRMGKSYFKDKENYLLNSPLHHADKITTPLLVWCGKDDPVVPWTQSLSLYLALRRLKRQSVMLAYSGESHALVDAKNQTDLSDRVLSWFGYYLKNEPADWITDKKM